MRARNGVPGACKNFSWSPYLARRHHDSDHATPATSNAGSLLASTKVINKAPSHKGYHGRTCKVGMVDKSSIGLWCCLTGYESSPGLWKALADFVFEEASEQVTF